MNLEIFGLTPFLNSSVEATITKVTKQFIPGYGGLAQLVERLLCKQDVSGSSPLTSISVQQVTTYFNLNPLKPFEPSCDRTEQFFSSKRFS